MIDPSVLRDHPDLVRSALSNRGADADAILAPLVPLDERRRALIVEVEGLKREQNEAADEVAKRKKAGEFYTPQQISSILSGILLARALSMAMASTFHRGGAIRAFSLAKISAAASVMKM